jgi:hypothetical protein
MKPICVKISESQVGILITKMACLNSAKVSPEHRFDFCVHQTGHHGRK